jgi:hypothetical protein
MTAWTTYDRRVPYSTYDVTALLKHGQSVLGESVGYKEEGDDDKGKHGTEAMWDRGMERSMCSSS